MLCSRVPSTTTLDHQHMVFRDTNFQNWAQPAIFLALQTVALGSRLDKPSSSAIMLQWIQVLSPIGGSQSIGVDPCRRWLFARVRSCRSPLGSCQLEVASPWKSGKLGCIALHHSPDSCGLLSPIIDALCAESAGILYSRRRWRSHTLNFCIVNYTCGLPLSRVWTCID